MADADRTRRELRISCADALELMTEYLEGALGPEDAERIRIHLEGCQPCSVFLDQLRATIRIAGQAADGEDAELKVGPDRMAGLVDLFNRERGG